VPELDIPPFDPIFVPVVLVDYKQENAEGKMIVRNSKVYGLKDGEILGFRLEIQTDRKLRVLLQSQGTLDSGAMGGRG
jgi:hypothetical protein